MKKAALISLGLAFSCVSPFALADFVTFTSIAQAQQYCPATGSLLFKPANPNIMNGFGSITGRNRINFTSSSTTMLRPANITVGGYIQNVKFREINAAFSGYGFISGNMINCFYTYPEFIGVDVALTMYARLNNK